MARIHKLPGRESPRYDVTFHPAAEKEFLDLPRQLQDRFGRAIDGLATDPFRARPGLDLKKLGELGPGEALYRLRVGEYRSCYAIVTGERKVLVLLFDARGAGFQRMIGTATARRRGRRWQPPTALSRRHYGNPRREHPNPSPQRTETLWGLNLGRGRGLGPGIAFERQF